MRAKVSLAWLALVAFCFAAAPQTNPLKELLSDLAMHGAWVGVLVQTSSNPPQTLFAVNEDKRFMPASNAKLFTTALALEKLRPDFTFVTPLLTDGKIDGERLDGNLYLKGVGDPSLTRERLRDLAKALATKGIKSVNGDIVVDVSAFSDNR